MLRALDSRSSAHLIMKLAKSHLNVVFLISRLTGSLFKAYLRNHWIDFQNANGVRQPWHICRAEHSFVDIDTIDEITSQVRPKLKISTSAKVQFRWLAAAWHTRIDAILAKLLANVYGRYYEGIEYVISTLKVKARSQRTRICKSHIYYRSCATR